MNETVINKGPWHLMPHSVKHFYHFQFGKEITQSTGFGIFGGNFLFFESVISICSPLIPGPFSASHECDFHFLCSQWWWKTQEAAGRA